MSEAKVRLKRAKDLIDEQQWQKALEILEHLCREDGDNPRPQALVLVGKCALELQNAHKALEAFRTAVKIQPDLIPAWQGLLMCHSRFPSPDLPAPPSVIGDGDEKARRNEELLEAYRRCLEHIGDNEQMKPRILEYLKGYAAQLIIKGRIEDALQTLQRLSLMATGYGNKDFRIGARKDIIRLLHPVKYQTDLFSLVEAHLELLLGTYRELLTEYDLGVIEDNFPQEHLSVLLQLSRVDEAVAFARKYAEDFGSPFAYAAILMFLLKAALQAGTLDDHLRSEIIVMQEKMASFDAQHPLVRISKAYQAYLKRDFIRSTELWEKALFSVKGLDTLPEAYKVPLLADLQLYSRKYLAISWVSTENTSSLSAGVDVLRECCQCIPDWQTFFYHGYAEISMGHVREAEQVLRGAYEFFAGPDHLDTRIIIGALEGALALKEGDYLKAEQSKSLIRAMWSGSEMPQNVVFVCQKR